MINAQSQSKPIKNVQLIQSMDQCQSDILNNSE